VSTVGAPLTLFAGVLPRSLAASRRSDLSRAYTDTCASRNARRLARMPSERRYYVETLGSFTDSS
jgi:hypothetical protein